MCGLLILLCLAWWACLILTGMWFGLKGVILALLASVILFRILLAIKLSDRNSNNRRRSTRGPARDSNENDGGNT